MEPDVHHRDERDAEELSLLRRLADLTPDLVYIYDAVADRNVYINDRVSDVLGYSPAEIADMGPGIIGRLIHPDDGAILSGGAQRWAATPKGAVSEIEYRLRHADGRWRWMSSREMVSARTPDGRVREVYGIARDITERKETEEAARAAAERLRVALETSGTIAFTHDPELRYTWIMNPALGYRPEELIGLTDGELFERQEDGAELMAVKRRVLESGVRERTLVCVGRAAERRWYDLTVEPLRGEEGAGAAGVMGAAHDVTDFKRMEESLRLAVEQRDVLLRELNHRVKNSLQIVSGLLSMQAMQMKDPAARLQFEQACDRVAAVGAVHAKLYQGCFVDRLDFAVYLADLRGQLERSLVNADGRVTIRVEAEPIMLDVDTAIPLGLLVNELVTNAVKHAFPNGRSGDIRILFRGLPDGRHRLVVADSGIGLPEGAARTDGLGLTLIHNLVQQVRGTMTVVPRPGAAFLIEF